MTRNLAEMRPDNGHDLPEEEVVYLGENPMGMSKDEQESQSTRRTRARTEYFRLMDLPAELRVSIYKHLLPHGLIITFDHFTRQIWATFAHTKDSQNLPRIIGCSENYPRVIFPRGISRYPKVETQLFLVDKIISSEARAVLYGSNTYTFHIDCKAHYPISFHSPQIFGPFGDTLPGGTSRLPLLRNLRHIDIIISYDDHNHWTVKRQRARLEYFVQILSQHSNDQSRKSLLQELNVTIRHPPLPARTSLDHSRPASYEAAQVKHFEKFMFGLESLAALRGVKYVGVQGVSEWYANCLQLCIQGRGGDVQETHWPLVEVKRRIAGAATKRTKKVWVTTRKWYQPLLDWKEFAERNEVEIPDDINQFWAERI